MGCTPSGRAVQSGEVTLANLRTEEIDKVESSAVLAPSVETSSCGSSTMSRSSNAGLGGALAPRRKKLGSTSSHDRHRPPPPPSNEPESIESSDVFVFGEFQVKSVDELMKRDDLPGSDWSAIGSVRHRNHILEVTGYRQIDDIRLIPVGPGLPSKVKAAEVAGRTIISCCADDHGATVLHMGLRIDVGSLFGHSNILTHIAASENGQLVATASRDAIIIVWDPSTFRRMWRLPHESSITAVTLSPDACYLVACCQDRFIRIWGMRNGLLVQTLEPHRGVVLSAKVSRFPYTLFTGSVDRSVHVQSLSGEYVSRRFSRHHNPVLSVDLVSDSQPAMAGPFTTGEDTPTPRMNPNVGSDSGDVHNPLGGAYPSAPDSATQPPSLSTSSNTNIALTADFQQALVWRIDSFQVLYALDMPAQMPLLKQVLPRGPATTSTHCVGAVFCPAPYNAYFLLATNTRGILLAHTEGKEAPLFLTSRSAITCISRKGKAIVAGDLYGNLYSIELR